MASTQPRHGMKRAPKTSVSFTLNGEPVVVQVPSPFLTLNEWIRAQPGLTGTKKMCGEGGCGCCVVAVTKLDPVTQQETTIAINSCLCLLYSVEGWHITTVEGIGSSRDGFHPIQQRIAQFNGSQCGYCTSGFVMNMYSLLSESPKPTKREVENHFDGNICRCTGYRAILDAMKSFAVDSDSSKGGCIDIEELGGARMCPRSGQPCRGGLLCEGLRGREGDPAWYAPSSLTQLFELMAAHHAQRVKLLAGDTGKGVFKAPEHVDIFVDLKGIPKLYENEVTSSSLCVGGAVSLKNLISLLQTNRDMSSTFEHLALHLLKVANVPVRNVGSWAGNLMLTHNYDNFPSDVFTMMAAVGATLTVATLSRGDQQLSWKYTTLSLWEFLKHTMDNSVIVSMEIPFASKNVVFRSFKIMPRAQNAHAYVNAAFCMEVDRDSFMVKGRPSFVYGGIDAHAITVCQTESFMEGKSLLDPNTLKGALASLEELSPSSPPVAASSQYRKTLATNLFYKFYLAVLGDSVPPSLRSAAMPYVRPVSQGSHCYSSKPSNSPLHTPMPKLNAKLQASGEAQYTTDIPTQAGELAAAFVLTTLGNANVTGIDFSKAEQMPGFVRAITAADIPKGGKNNFLPYQELFEEPEKILVNDFSQYAGQAVAIILADTPVNATKIAGMVEVQYESVGKPILSVKEVIAAGASPKATTPTKQGDAMAAITASDHIIEGEISCGDQFHFSMETQTALCVPEDDGYSVFSSTQWTALTQAAVANILGVPASSVNVSVKQLGGAYGSKITRGHWIAAACALGAHVSRRPVRMHMDIDSNMKMVGGRLPYYAKYKIGCSKEGQISGIEVDLYADSGCSLNDSFAVLAAACQLDNAYYIPNWLVTSYICKTNTSSKTYCRAPGILPGIFISESMMDHVAKVVGKDVEEVKRAHLYKKDQVNLFGFSLKHCNITSLWEHLYQSADVASRKKAVTKFNKANRWRKRGISVIPIQYNLGYAYNVPVTVLVSIYSTDGTVSVSHGGVEYGQGINTKVAQFTAKTLGIPLDMVKVKPTGTLTNPNGSTSGGSVTTELNCYAVLNACKQLKERINPVKEKHPEASWEELMQICGSEKVDLSAKYYLPDGPVNFGIQYVSFGVTCTEVEVDVLTGQTQILRVDIIQDAGESINPHIDVGQVEGGFVMGLGYWLTEKYVYEQQTGQLLTHNTWEYKPPSSHDIPIDFRVELLKDAPNPLGVVGSKGIGEPPTCMSCSALFAVKRAIESARAEIGKDVFFPLCGPATVEDIQQACLTDPSQLVVE